MTNKNKQAIASKNFIHRAKKIHCNKYDYSKTHYINAKTKVKIICKVHGEWLVIPRFHIRKTMPSGCPKCANNIKYSQQDFVDKCYKVHGKILYDYSKSVYINNDSKVKIFCNKCLQFFNQSSRNHLHGQGCPCHKKSKGELGVELFLKEHNIKYKSQKTFDNCIGIKRKLPFDFYLPQHNCCIEYDGEQHYRNAFGDNHFKKLKINDKIKNKFCKDNQIKLIRIPFWKKEKVQIIIKKFLCISP